MTNKYLTILITAGALVLAACGSDVEARAGDSVDDDQPTTEGAGSGGEDGENPASDLVEEITENLDETQAAEGGGSATFVVGDETWTFEAVLCAIGEEETGQQGAEFVLSSVEGGLQMYVSIDSFGHNVTLDDIEDFENPSVSLASTGSDFVNVDGKSVSAQAEFSDATSDDFATKPGTFTATCP